MELSRNDIGKISLWIILVVTVLFAYSMATKSQSSFLDAQNQLVTCKTLARDIESLKDRPGFAALGIDSPRTITVRAEQAVLSADINPASLARIEPQSAVRLRDSAYRVRPTRLELRRVTLEQILNFTHAMVDEAKGTTVRDMRLTASDGSAESDTESWNAELVLTQLIFAPLRK